MAKPSSGHGTTLRPAVGGKQSAEVDSGLPTAFPFCLFKLPVIFPASRLFLTGWPNRYRGGRPLSQQNRRLLSVEELVKLHFSVKARFSEEAAVVLFFFSL